MRIFREGRFAVIDTGVHVYTAEITAEDRTPFSGVQPYFFDTDVAFPINVGDYTVISYGAENNLPEELRKILDENHSVPEMLNKQTQLLWGQGPLLHKVIVNDGKRTKLWLEDKEIQNWLSDWDYEGYLLKSAIEYRHVNGHFTKYYRNRGARAGFKARIATLEHVSSRVSRLEWPDEKDKIKHIITGDFTRPWKKGLKRYPVFDAFDPFRHPVSMHYSNMYSFALENDYSRPSYNGLLNWIKLSSSIPKLLMNYNVNAASIRYHIKSPAVYWQKKEDQLKKNCELKGIEYKDSMLEDLKDEIFLKVAEGLVGIEKAGKMLTTETIYDDIAQAYAGWEVDVIDQKVKDFISAQLETAKRADFAITAGEGLHPALSNMTADGNLPSGSEQLYAFKLYLSTGIDIPESIVCKDLNNAIKANFPKKNIKIGFYHDNVLTEEATPPTERTKNAK